MSTKVSSLLFAAPLLLLGACEEQTISRTTEGTLYLGAYEASDVIERVISPGGRRFVLDGYSGSIRISGSMTDVARLSITRRARGDTPSEAQSNLAGLDIEEEGDETAFRYRFSPDKPEISRYDITGELPPDTPLVIRWTSGKIEVEGLGGPVDVHTVNGDVVYAGTSRQLRLQSKNGDVTASLLEPPRPQSPDTLVPARSASPSYELVTANGDITASVPTSIDIRVDATTSAGNIRTADMPFVSEKFGPVNAGARFTARLGQGNGRMQLATQHGSVTLRPSAATHTAWDSTRASSDSTRAVGHTKGFSEGAGEPSGPTGSSADSAAVTTPSRPEAASVADSAGAPSN